MDFNQLMARMKELDQPVAEAPTQECGEPMGMTPPMGMPSKPDTPPPSMSVNLNAQGLDDIAELMKLMTKVNPDMEKPSMPPLPLMGADPSIASIKPELPPLKMLPEPIDRDGEEDGELDNDKEKEEIGGALAGGALGAAVGGPLGALTGAAAGDSLTDPDADEVEKDEAFGNSLDGSEPEEQGNPFDAEGNDIHKPKQMFKRSQPGDNPMAAESTDLRAQIRAELLRRLNEAKGAK
jgi:hypothetical protein